MIGYMIGFMGQSLCQGRVCKAGYVLTGGLHNTAIGYHTTYISLYLTICMQLERYEGYNKNEYNIHYV